MVLRAGKDDCLRHRPGPVQHETATFWLVYSSLTVTVEPSWTSAPATVLDSPACLTFTSCSPRKPHSAKLPLASVLPLAWVRQRYVIPSTSQCFLNETRRAHSSCVRAPGLGDIVQTFGFLYLNSIPTHSHLPKTRRSCARATQHALAEIGGAARTWPRMLDSCHSELIRPAQNQNFTSTWEQLS